MIDIEKKGRYSNKLLAERYLLKELMGTGPVAEVYLCTDQQGGMPVAVKVFEDRFLGGEDRRVPLRALLASVNEVHAPNLVRVMDFELTAAPTGRIASSRWRDPRPSFLVMERLHGLSLARRVAEEGPLPLEDGLFILGQVLEGLERAHQAGLVHGGISPENVILRAGHEMHYDQVRLCDLGCSARVLSAGLPGGVRRLAPILDPYSSPEQLQGLAPEARSDLYSAATVLFYALTGEPPYPITAEMSREQVLDMRFDIPWLTSASKARVDDVDAWLALIRVAGKAMNRNPQVRPGSCAELWQQFLDELGPRIPSPSVSAPSCEPREEAAQVPPADPAATREMRDYKPAPVTIPLKSVQGAYKRRSAPVSASEEPVPGSMASAPGSPPCSASGGELGTEDANIYPVHVPSEEVFSDGAENSEERVAAMMTAQPNATQEKLDGPGTVSTARPPDEQLIDQSAGDRGRITVVMTLDEALYGQIDDDPDCQAAVQNSHMEKDEPETRGEALHDRPVGEVEEYTVVMSLEDALDCEQPGSKPRITAERSWSSVPAEEENTDRADSDLVLPEAVNQPPADSDQDDVNTQKFRAIPMPELEIPEQAWLQTIVLTEEDLLLEQDLLETGEGGDSEGSDTMDAPLRLDRGSEWDAPGDSGRDTITALQGSIMPTVALKQKDALFGSADELEPDPTSQLPVSKMVPEPASLERVEREAGHGPAVDLLEEAGLAWEIWEQGLTSPLFSLSSLAEGPERRLLSAVDSLAAEGGSGRARRLHEELSSLNYQRVFAAALALAHSGDGEQVGQIIPRLSGMASVQLSAVVRALQLSSIQGHEDDLLALRREKSTNVRAAALEVLRFHKVDLGRMLEGFIHGEDPELLCAVVHAARAPSGRLFCSLVQECMDSGSIELRNAALVTGLIHGLPYAWKRCHEVVQREEPEPRTAMLLLSLLGGADQLRLLMEVGNYCPQQQPDAIFALGFSGNPTVADFCLAVMSEPRLARLGGEAFCAITGLDLEEHGLLVSPPLGFRSEHVPEKELLIPEPGGVRSWWVENRHRFDDETGYLLGKPFGLPSLLDALQSGPMRRRHTLALEISIRTQGAVQLQIDNWCARQAEDQQCLFGLNFNHLT